VIHNHSNFCLLHLATHRWICVDTDGGVLSQPTFAAPLPIKQQQGWANLFRSTANAAATSPATPATATAAAAADASGTVDQSAPSSAAQPQQGGVMSLFRRAGQAQQQPQQVQQQAAAQAAAGAQLQSSAENEPYYLFRVCIKAAIRCETTAKHVSCPLVMQNFPVQIKAADDGVQALETFWIEICDGFISIMSFNRNYWTIPSCDSKACIYTRRPKTPAVSEPPSGALTAATIAQPASRLFSFFGAGNANTNANTAAASSTTAAAATATTSATTATAESTTCSCASVSRPIVSAAAGSGKYESFLLARASPNEPWVC
jgi:hypothetical protein